MQEHPVPQNVTGYEFHLIGQMTLKQFFLLGGGVLGAVIVNAVGTPALFKWPLMITFVLGGAALAFVPYEGRPLDRWFFAFLASIYKPTLFYWKKTNPRPEVFDYTAPTTLVVTTTVQDVDLTHLRSQRVNDFLQTVSAPEGQEADMWSDEKGAIDGIMKLFSAPLIEPTFTTPTIHANQPDTSIQSSPAKTTAPEKEVFVASVNAPLEPAKPVEVKKTATVPLPESKPLAAIAPQEIGSSEHTQKTDESLQPVRMSTALPFPAPPSKPNMVVGMVLTPDQKIVDNAIVEIVRRSDGTPARALKTNALGQFAIVTPLAKGEYEIAVEKNGLTFEKTLLVVNDTILQPILIQAT
ncbi:hypothetical protein C5B42_01770 [Candidatus Cerribacteria bacterium 'Amazon FNV 2010 28 9']|uniref:PrgI family protein n=1 Tax=Candidatus Cerribacteria bacterium 'Amazon FNV 2010 28 9' TaxID=2081795 RepID=A0A317JRY6_9BACT|nr:MAG: hypothetical protein C5B42_01770 [Candidatus Cerribacteria bacterium 'Amazon FNV 2010 28 9']